jgi:hypothetical protein
MAAGLEVRAVDTTGVHLTAREDVVVDVLFDARRVWSFWTLRDSERQGDERVAQWPAQLRRFVDGTTRLAVVEHVSGHVAYDEELTLGTSTDRIAVVDRHGRPMGIDKSNRLAVTFDTRDPAQTEPLLDACERVLAVLAEAGVDAFPAYGTLLGAIREQDFIGHDSDVDLGYVSRKTHPYDVVRESHHLQRVMTEAGFEVHRYSGAAFKVDVIESDGGVRGLDVFGGYFLGDRLYLMGEVGTPFRKEWIFPLGTCTLAGRTLPAPARPEKLLEAMYGPGWQVPDPAFHFETPRTTVRRLNGWFRGLRVHRADWDRRYSGVREKLPRRAPSPLAEFVAEQEPDLELLVDVGAGRGGDSLWFARRGVATMALDHSFGAANAVQRVAAKESLDHEVVWFNLHELRSVLTTGARVAHRGRRTTVMANHLLDATDARGTEALARFARMALSGGGRLYADFHVAPAGTAPGPVDGTGLRSRRLDQVLRTFERMGADIVSSTQTETAAAPGDNARPVARLVAQWRK